MRLDGGALIGTLLTCTSVQAQDSRAARPIGRSGRGLFGGDEADYTAC
jgi:hypothetical protein